MLLVPDVVPEVDDVAGVVPVVEATGVAAAELVDEVAATGEMVALLGFT